MSTATSPPETGVPAQDPHALRFDAGTLLPSLVAGLTRASRHADGPLPATTLDLVVLRVSQLNGCAFCCDLHTRQAEKAGVDPLVLRALPGWRELRGLDEATRAALTVAEALTTLDAGVDPGPVLDEASPVLGTDGLAQVVGAVAVISAWNRLQRAAAVPPDPTFA